VSVCCTGKYFLDFDIPVELEHLWRYMYHMYQLDAFTQSCPADQDIINHYKLQQVGVSTPATNNTNYCQVAFAAVNLCSVQPH
jgi:hypothetical protein